MRVFLLSILFTFSVFAAEVQFKTSQTENLRILKNEVLEIAEVLPSGSTLAVDVDRGPETHLYRLSNGRIERSSNGFLPMVRIISADLHPSRIEELNAKNLWISVGSVPVGNGETFPALTTATPGEDFLKNFEESGKPKFNFSSYYKTRFPKSLNRAVAADDLSEVDRKKWTAIMRELTLAGDRSRETKTRYLYIPQKEATAASIAYEDRGEVSDFGAWTIAVKATAVRHGFSNVPCAEFMSEMLRQAYKRAGYDHTEDFNAASGTELIWNKTAAVVNLTNTLYKAGWIPWELAYYRPPAGAIMAHFKATTPGHVYMAAGLDGRLIVDNGSPKGRKLTETTEKVIKMMYYGGVFFLPPGINPLKW